jgi:hypothetical protein
VPEQAEEPPRYGIVKNLGTVNPIRIALHEYVGIARDLARRGLTLRQRLGYFFGPPGWRHVGQHATTASLRAAEDARRERSQRVASAPSVALSASASARDLDSAPLLAK